MNCREDLIRRGDLLEHEETFYDYEGRKVYAVDITYIIGATAYGQKGAENGRNQPEYQK